MDSQFPLGGFVEKLSLLTGIPSYFEHDYLKTEIHIYIYYVYRIKLSNIYIYIVYSNSAVAWGRTNNMAGG